MGKGGDPSRLLVPGRLHPGLDVRRSPGDPQPGALPNIVTLDNMRTTRYSRNPRIARTLVEFGWVRELNEGVKRIYTEMQDSLLNDPVYTEPGGTKVQLTLENNIVARTVRRSEALEDRISAEAIASLADYELAAVRLAFTNGKVTARGLAEHIGRDRRTASRVLGKLIGEGGLLEWHGSSPNDPRQFYTIRWAEVRFRTFVAVVSHLFSLTPATVGGRILCEELQRSVAAKNLRGKI